MANGNAQCLDSYHAMPRLPRVRDFDYRHSAGCDIPIARDATLTGTNT